MIDLLPKIKVRLFEKFPEISERLDYVTLVRKNMQWLNDCDTFVTDNECEHCLLLKFGNACVRLKFELNLT